LFSYVNVSAKYNMNMYVIMCIHGIIHCKYSGKSMISFSYKKEAKKYALKFTSLKKIIWVTISIVVTKTHRWVLNKDRKK